MNNRFRIAVVEFDNDNKFEVIDKTDNQELDLNSFKEGIRFPYEKIRTNQLIVFYKPKLAPKRCVLLKEKGCRIIFFGRNQMVYLPEILQEDGRHIIENHNPMTDNPFLVVYKFRE